MDNTIFCFLHHHSIFVPPSPSSVIPHFSPFHISHFLLNDKPAKKAKPCTKSCLLSNLYPNTVHRMYRIHPTESKIDVGELAKTSTSPSVWTVWTKSSMAFHGTDGFSVYDSNGRLAFRVDNYSRRHKCFTGELLLMDGGGTALITLKPQILSMHDRWSGFKGDDGSKTKITRSHVFSMRRRSILQSSDEAEIFMGNPNNQTPTPNFRTEGCFRRRCWKILDSMGKEVAQIYRKKVNTTVMLGDDVFSLVIQPGVDCELIMAFVVIMDRICQKPFAPAWMCS